MCFKWIYALSVLLFEITIIFGYLFSAFIQSYPKLCPIFLRCERDNSCWFYCILENQIAECIYIYHMAILKSIHQYSHTICECVHAFWHSWCSKDWRCSILGHSSIVQIFLAYLMIFFEEKTKSWKWFLIFLKVFLFSYAFRAFH